MAEAKKATPAKAAQPKEPTKAEIEANEQPNPLLAEDADDAATIASVPGASDIHRAEAHLAAEDETGPVDTTPPAYVYLEDDANKGGVSMADVASLQGIQVAPDASTVVTAVEKDVFVSEGMRNDLDMHGWALDPATGKKVVRK